MTPAELKASFEAAVSSAEARDVRAFCDAVRALPASPEACAALEALLADDRLASLPTEGDLSAHAVVFRRLAWARRAQPHSEWKSPLDRWVVATVAHAPWAFLMGVCIAVDLPYRGLRAFESLAGVVPVVILPALAAFAVVVGWRVRLALLALGAGGAGGAFAWAIFDGRSGSCAITVAAWHTMMPWVALPAIAAALIGAFLLDSPAGARRAA